MTGDSNRDSKSELLQAAQAAVKDSEEKAAELAVASRRAPRRTGLMAVLATIGVAGAVLLILQPAWLAGPATVPPDPPPVAAAGLRVNMLRQRQLVFDYSKAHGGRLPASLAEVGDTVPGVHYVRLSDSGFKLTGHAGDSVVVLQSGDAQAAFLGNSLRILKNRGGQ